MMWKKSKTILRLPFFLQQPDEGPWKKKTYFDSNSSETILLAWAFASLERAEPLKRENRLTAEIWRASAAAAGAAYSTTSHSTCWRFRPRKSLRFIVWGCFPIENVHAGRVATKPPPEEICWETVDLGVFTCAVFRGVLSRSCRGGGCVDVDGKQDGHLTRVWKTITFVFTWECSSL